ncbi:MAG: T9SS type A sorting domain-containing protein [Chitinophagales bacterium]|nr:T9SS type A sorting domain-containing protein [Chitinophagales bacterium]
MKTYIKLLKRSCALVGPIFFFLTTTIAQKQDYVWLSGYNSAYVEDTGLNAKFGVNKIDFNTEPAIITRDSLGMGFRFTNVSYSNANGNLLFYSNGIYIANSLDERIENSDSMNAGFWQYEWDLSAQDIGYITYNGILALEDPSSPGSFYLIHSFIDTVDANLNFGCTRIYSTYLDMNANAGRGKVLAKDQTILSGRFGYELKATRHANGRDWWLLVQKRSTNCYERILIDDKGIHTLGTTCGGQSVNGASGSACFSQDGSKYVYVGMYGGINLFDFDRCTGELSNPQYFPLTIFQDLGAIGIGSAFSPKGRFLYVNATIHCYQFDLWAADVWTSIDTVAVYDGFAAPFGSAFHTMQIAPDGKIYSSCGNTEWVYHVIDSPDRKGDSCLFKQHGVELPSYSGGVPNFVNYRLGALAGSPCDTIASRPGSGQEKDIRVYPNPATDFVTVDYGFTNWSKGEIFLEITNGLGQIVYRQKPPMYSGLQKIEVSRLAAGVYQITLQRNGLVTAKEQFSKL